MEHPSFSEAGTNPGIEIWTIDKFEPVAIDSKMYGKFYNGDSYIVLKTTGDDTTTLAYDAHFWLGSKTTQDKKGSAAILTITLDDMLGGKAVHHREVQGHESSQFIGYFKPAIRYLEGGNESGFNEVETNAGAEKRLLRLSGCDNMRIEEVTADSSSLTKDHCFILEVDHDIFVLMPEGAKATQRRKIISVANTLRDDYHNGRATIEIIDEFSSDDDVASFFEALGSGSMDDLKEADDTDTYTRDGTSAFLYKVLVGNEIDLVTMNKPYKQKHLQSDEVYILDTPCCGVFIWLGANVDSDTKKNYNDIAQKYIDKKGYPSWVNITRVSEGSESYTFKQYFHNWDTITLNTTSVKGFVSEIDAGYFSNDADESATTAKLIGKSAAARGYMPDDGLGSITVTRISDGSEDVTEDFNSGATKMYQGEVYVVTYRYNKDNGDDAVVVYWWIGADASADDKWTAYEQVSSLEEEFGDSVTATVKVPQGKEPKHFLSIFKGKLGIFFGKKGDDSEGVRLFRVEGTESDVDMRMVQVEANSNVLEDDDVFILETDQIVYVRNGQESEVKEHEAAVAFVPLLGTADDKEVCVVAQGDEPGDFWDAIGGVAEEKEDASGWRLAVNRRVTARRTLTAVTVTGKIKFEELPEYSQQDLSDDGAYILDTGEELYLWQGSNIPERVKKARADIIQAYIKDDGLDRTVESAIVVSVKQGQEPGVFKKLFSDWDEDMWSNQDSYEDIKNQTKAGNN